MLTLFYLGAAYQWLTAWVPYRPRFRSLPAPAPTRTTSYKSRLDVSHRPLAVRPVLTPIVLDRTKTTAHELLWGLQDRTRREACHRDKLWALCDQDARMYTAEYAKLFHQSYKYRFKLVYPRSATLPVFTPIVIDRTRMTANELLWSLQDRTRREACYRDDRWTLCDQDSRMYMAEYATLLFHRANTKSAVALIPWRGPVYGTLVSPADYGMVALLPVLVSLTAYLLLARWALTPSASRGLRTILLLIASPVLLPVLFLTLVARKALSSLSETRPRQALVETVKTITPRPPSQRKRLTQYFVGRWGGGFRPGFLLPGWKIEQIREAAAERSNEEGGGTQGRRARMVQEARRMLEEVANTPTAPQVWRSRTYTEAVKAGQQNYATSSSITLQRLDALPPDIPYQGMSQINGSRTHRRACTSPFVSVAHGTGSGAEPSREHMKAVIAATLARFQGPIAPPTTASGSATLPGINTQDFPQYSTDHDDATAWGSPDPGAGAPSRSPSRTLSMGSSMSWRSASKAPARPSTSGLSSSRVRTKSAADLSHNWRERRPSGSATQAFGESQEPSTGGDVTGGRLRRTTSFAGTSVRPNAQPAQIPGAGPGDPCVPSDSEASTQPVPFKRLRQLTSPGLPTSAAVWIGGVAPEASQVNSATSDAKEDQVEEGHV